MAAIYFSVVIPLVLYFCVTKISVISLFCYPLFTIMLLQRYRRYILI
ncbi:hypothetical protein HMPREF0208_04369 [Citrobacter koseri]|nr:hypothetical protein HMPREF0208_04369 [Citrobacter koseri]